MRVVRLFVIMVLLTIAILSGCNIDSPFTSALKEKINADFGEGEGEESGDTTIPVTGVSLDKNATTITVGSTEQLTAAVEPSNATDTSVSWSSDNESAATVDSGGVVTAVADGTATITVATTDGGFTASCEVTATTATIPVTGVSLNKSATTITVGSTEQLTAAVEPSNATDTSVSWSSDNESVATVDSGGVVTAVADGTATITVATTDGGFTASCEVTATTATIPVTGVSLNKSATTITVGSTEQLTAAVEPSNATDKSVTWSSDNESAATVDSGGVVTAVADGTATVTVATTDGGFTASCEVTAATDTHELTVIADTGGTITEPTTSPETVADGAPTTITAAPDTGYNFTGWSVTSGTAAIADSSSASTTVVLEDGDATVSAAFSLKTYALAVQADTGGSITTPANSPMSVNHGEQTTITAAANTDYVFDRWSVTSGTATIADSGSSSTTVTLENGNATVTAYFLPTYQLSVETDPGGTITDPASSPVTVVHGVATSISATADSSYIFDSWSVTSGSAAITDSSSDSTTVVLENGDATVTATWEALGEGTITINDPSSPTFSMTPTTFTLQVGGGTTEQTITVSPGQGVIISNYEWFINGTSREAGVSNDSISLDTAAYPGWFELGGNTLTLVVVIDGLPYSDNFHFTVEQY